MVSLCKTKTWWKSKTVLYGYRQFHCIHKTDDIYEDIAEDFETRFGFSNYDLKRPLPKGKNRKVIGAMKDELSGKIMKKFVGLRAKTYSYLADNNDEDEKTEGTKSVS